MRRHKTGRLQEAQRAFELAYEIAAHGHIDQATVHYERALALRPDYPEAHSNLGNMLAAQGKKDEAITHYERALALRPDYPEAHNNLGIVLAAQGKKDEAVTHYKRALALKPDFADTHNNLGNALVAQGKLDQAVAHLERALALKPEARIHYNLGLALMAQGQIDQAVAHYERALALRPDYPEAHSDLGLALAAQGRMVQAVAHYERALALMPDFAAAHNNLGLALMAQGQIDQAVAHYERALALMPDFAAAHSNLLLALNYASGNDPVAVYTAHLKYAEQRETPQSTSIAVHANDRSLERRLRIGYVSSDFRQHSVGYFIESVLENHDRRRFEIFCYSNHLHEDGLTKRLQTHAAHWRPVFGLSDESVAQQIGADQIDILIDLNGHTSLNRLLVFARKPAPVQVTWLGYPNTTGLSAMDYRLTDGFADPVGITEHLHSEKLIRLPECFSCYRPPPEAPEVSGLPMREKGYLTFGSFNNLAKITPEVMATWAKILLAVPGSRLTLKNLSLSEDPVRQSVREAFAHFDVVPGRLELLGHEPSQNTHLQRYGSVDIGLDPFPYNGATTTCEALWMGVPVVTLAGNTHAGRVGASQLSNLGLTELIANSVEEYIATASQLAADPERLGVLRRGLRARMAVSPLTDGQGFTQNLEQAYLNIWSNWSLRQNTDR